MTDFSPERTSAIVLPVETLTADQWQAEGYRRFGPHVNNWRFICPACGYEASVYDWKKVCAPEGGIAFNCIGHYLPENQRRDAFNDDGPGPCNYTGGGALKLNPVFVTTPDEVIKKDPTAPKVLAYFAFGEPNEYAEIDEDEPVIDSDVILIPDDLYHFIDAHDDDDLSDGAWFQVLEDSVTAYNKEHGTEFDSNDAVHSYIARKSDEQKEDTPE